MKPSIPDYDLSQRACQLSMQLSQCLPNNIRPRIPQFIIVPQVKRLLMQKNEL